MSPRHVGCFVMVWVGEGEVEEGEDQVDEGEDQVEEGDDQVEEEEKGGDS